MSRGTPKEAERQSQTREHRLAEGRAGAQPSAWDTLRTTLSRWFGVDADASGRTEGSPRNAPTPREEGPKERIRRLLVEAGGKLDQSEIVERTQWAGSTISRNLSDMEHEGAVDRYRVGSGKRVVLVED